jgi:hypothetical protein
MVLVWDPMTVGERYDNVGVLVALLWLGWSPTELVSS